MKRFWTACLVVVWVGCGGTGDAPPSEDTQAQVALPETEPETDLQTRLNPEQEADLQFAEEMKALVRTANEHEAAERYTEAAGVWGQIIRQLEDRFGKDCWQAANARLARHTAELQAGFQPAERESVRQIADLQRQLANAIDEGEVQIAGRLAQKSVDQSVELFGESSAVTAKQRHQFARLLKQLNIQVEAARAYERALLDLSLRFAEVHPDLIAIHEDLAEIYARTGDPARQLEHLRSATSQAGKIWGEDSVQYAKRANQLGVAYHQTGQAAAALKILKAAEAIRRMKLGPDHVQVGHSLLNIGTVEIDLQQYSESIENLEQALTIFRSSDKWSDWQDLTLEKLGTSHMLANQPGEAEPYLAERLEKAIAERGVDDPEVAELQYRLAIALGRQGKYEAAERTLASAIETQQTKLGVQHSSTVKSITAYALLLKQTGRDAEAQELQSRLRMAQNPDNSFQPRKP